MKATPLSRLEPPPPARGWRPILEGPETERAQQVLADLIRTLQDPRTDLPVAAGGASLAGGDAGKALFFAYLSWVDPQPGHEARALDWLSRSIDGLDGLLRFRGLFQGPLGVAWCVEHLGGWFLSPAPEDPNGEMDAWLAHELGDATAAWPYDLIGGLAGVGLYALERERGPYRADLLDRVVARLDSASVATPQGRAWFTAPEELHPHQREDAPQGYFNLGLSHGVAGVLAFLARALEARPGWAAPRQLLDEAVPWLLAQRGTDGGESCFPSWVGAGVARRPSRLAWCYGDLGLATALLAAGRAAGNPSWEAAGLAIARHAAGRPESCSGVRDVAICHGAAGVSLAFNRFFQATGEACFQEAARFWLLWALARHRPGEGVGGFPLWVPSRAPDQPRMPQLGLLEGAAGLGLVLLSALHPVAPRWDRMLLLS